VAPHMATRELTFGSWLAAELARKGWSYDQAAKELGSTKTTIYRWVKGQVEPRFSEIRKIWQVLGPFPPALMRMYLQGATSVA
jgi:transcriptional regulator with XRE-family HTH domain